MIKLETGLIEPANTVHIAFSGGEDSTAIANFLKRGGYKAKLLHVVHNCPEDGSAEIEAGVRKVADALELDLIVLRNNDILFTPGASKEAWCREVRYNLFKNWGQIVTGHHLDDLAEGYLQNCLAGNPMRMPIQKSLRLEGATVVRPFLRTRKRDFRAYVERHNLSHLIVPEPLYSQRQHFRDTVLPALGTDLTKVAERLFLKG